MKEGTNKSGMIIPFSRARDVLFVGLPFLQWEVLCCCLCLWYFGRMLLIRGMFNSKLKELLLYKNERIALFHHKL